jgi:hypothetical protein
MAKRSFESFDPDALALAEAESVDRSLSFCDARPVSSRMCKFQGMYSKSAIVGLSDVAEVSRHQIDLYGMVAEDRPLSDCCTVEGQ